MNEQIPDHILDQALAKYLSGESLVSIVSAYPEYQVELTEWLSVVQHLQNVPIAQAPTPTMRYRYAEKVSVWSKIFQTMSFYKLAAVPLVLMMIFAGGFSVLHAAGNSLPGERLYGLKIATEKAKLNLTFDQDKVAQLHVEYAQKRIEEAKQVIAINDADQEAAAIDALTRQTEETFSEVSSLAAAKAVSENNPALLENLVAINKEQKSVLQTVADSEETKVAAENALTATKETDKSLAQLIATVNEQALLDLPNKISINGVMASFLNNRLSVEKNVFLVNKETIVTGPDGELVNDLTTIKGQITVIGTRENNDLVAKKIVIIDPTAVLVTTKPATTTTTTPKPTPAPAPTTEPVDTQVQQPTEAQAGFIAEPGSTQF